MERLPRRTPTAQMDIVGLVFDAIAGMVEDIPIIGDIVGFVASLFGRSSTANARLSRLEAVVSKGASGIDLFNRVDASTLGTGPGMPGAWVQGGNGQALGVYGNAARLSPGGIPSAGRRWAKFPLVASTSAMAVEIGVDDRAISSDDMTTIIVCANSDFTEGIAANLFGVGVYLARFARSGNTWTFTDFAQDTAYKVDRTQSVELRASGSGLYTLWIDNQRVIGGDLPSFPIDAAHRWGGFAIRCSIPFPFVYRLGIGVAVFAMRSESEAFTAIETVETIANGAATTANNAATTAGNAQTTANGAAAAVEGVVDTAVGAATAAAETAVVTIIAPVQNAVNLIQSTAPTKPFYETMNKTQDVSFPRALLNASPKRAVSLGGTTSPLIGWETIITGNSDGGRNWSTTHVPAYLPTVNVVEAVFIPAQYPGPRGTITFIAEAVSGPCALQVVVGRMQSNGKPVIEWVSANQTGVMANSRTEHTVTMPDDLLFDLGENIWVGIHQYGSGTPRALFGIEYPDIPRAGDLYPPQAKNSLTASSSLSSSVGMVIETTSLSFTSRFLPWIGVGQRFTTLVVPRVFVDSFTDAMSSRWSQKSTQAATISGGYFTVSGTNDGVRRYLWAQALATDDQSVEGVTGTGINTRYQRLIIRSNPANTSYVALTLNVNGVVLDWVTSESYTGLASHSHTPATGNTYRVSAIGNLYQVEMKPSGSATWTVLFTYNDTANAIPHGDGYRYVGIGVERQPFAVNSGNWDSWRAADVETA